MRKAAIVLLAVSVLLAASAWAIYSNWPRGSDFDSVRGYVLQDEKDLATIADYFSETRNDHQLCDRIGWRPHSIDSNGNVYFIVDANTFSTTGFVHQNGQSKILGDGSEPHVAQLDRIKGRWWYYIAN